MTTPTDALPVVAWSLGNPQYCHSSNILAANEFAPDSEHADEWTALCTLSAAQDALAAQAEAHPGYAKKIEASSPSATHCAQSAMRSRLTAS
jgi:hypothetical protein